MTADAVGPDELPVEDRARKAAAEAAARAAAYVLYVDQAEEMDIEPKDSLEELSEKAQRRWIKKAEALLSDAQPASPAAPATPQQQPEAPQPQQSTADAVTAYAGGIRVAERDADMTYVDEESGEFQPPFPAVVLKVVRGNMANAMRVPVDLLAPDVTGGAGSVIEQFKNGFLQAQQQGQPTMPLRPTEEYGLRFKDGTVLHKTSRLRISDFTESLEEEPSLPGAEAELIDLQGEARTTTPQAQQQGPVGQGNPVVIQGGAVIGKPVAGGAQPQQPQRPSQGEARV